MAFSTPSSTENNTVGNGTSPQSFTFDIGTRTNGLLIAFFFTSTATSKAPSSILWNGVNLDFITEEYQPASIYYRATIAWLTNPANGSNTLEYTATLTSTETISFMVLWVDGANQTQANVKDQHAVGSGNTDPSLGPITPTENNELIAAGYLSESNNVLTIGSWGTELQNHDFGPRVCGIGYAIQTTAVAVTPDWSGIDDAWVGVCASFKEHASAPVSVDFFGPVLPQNMRIPIRRVGY